MMVMAWKGANDIEGLLSVTEGRRLEQRGFVSRSRDLGKRVAQLIPRPGQMLSFVCICYQMDLRVIGRRGIVSIDQLLVNLDSQVLKRQPCGLLSPHECYYGIFACNLAQASFILNLKVR